MLKNLIVIENGKEYQFDTLEEVVKELIDEKFYEMTQQEKIDKMKIKALANCITNKMEVTKKIPENVDNKFIIKDEITFILSLLLTNNILLLERKDADILAKDLNKENINDNYIIVNSFAKELLEKYI